MLMLMSVSAKDLMPEALALLKWASTADYFGIQHNGHWGVNRYLAPGDMREHDFDLAAFEELIKHELIEANDATVPGGPPGESGRLDYHLTAEGKQLLADNDS
ncbi:hypothetical protein MF271_18980 (plasmid) [Deinococcus sp. KNUC1210]|uniref:hypothetical protein n=1 Tax=Deinococcus sp. KNUC1210 TaxID=2917691 RepID=UPI001EEFB9D2|nr:hypothetical protein [Deinococcus sp. KNUC1210]ULH17406.1 hypothetical protein MF271_18980 [Deinococcus sp. KNUC1210]